ncbi:COX15/CtaA family protein [Alicyclobacillus suci]|uniref:COX15/CtaA family protein n=1 Tax=Alicyclobacillus suci TaxID=2816080 RepID=UPI001A8DC89F|nr:COX15/CtaA family protein [Alicyclobacillus suci]
MKFHHLAWATTVVIGLQMILAGIIVGEDAGFVCPNWPVCGHPISISGSLIFELVHRFVAALLGVFVIWLFIWLLVSYCHNRAMMWTCCLGLVSLLIQIVYAGLIVLFVFPGTATTVDVLNSMVMLSLFVHLANLAQRDDQIKHSAVLEAPNPQCKALKRAAWILYVCGLLAVAAGAVFRHTGASQALFGQDSYISSHGRHVPPSQMLSQSLLGIHMVTAALLILAGIWFALTTFKHKYLRNVSVLIFALIVIQGILGVVSLQTALEIVVVTFHWGVAGLIIGVIAFALSRLYLPGANAREELS